MILLTHEPIDYAVVTEAVRDDNAGAVVLFLGTVREMTDTRQTVALQYEAYAPMAEAKLREVAEQTQQRWPVRKIALAHRIGPLAIGDIAVAVAVSCPHRAEAFEAAKFAMDTIKRVVPIWKQEQWADGNTEWQHPVTDVRAKPEGTP